MRKSFHYFAYGSNMLTARIRERCPSAALKTIANLSGFTVSFSKPSVDQSGKATLVRSDVGGPGVIGAVYEIATAERDYLNKAEGPGYDKHDDFLVTCICTGDSITTSTYIAREHEGHLKPYDWYLALVIAGIVEHELDLEYASTFREIEYGIDTKTDRPSRQAAVNALQLAGYPDYTKLLSN